MLRTSTLTVLALAVLLCATTLFVTVSAEDAAPTAEQAAADVEKVKAEQEALDKQTEAHELSLKQLEEGVAKILAEHKETFTKHDTDKDGKMSKDEFFAMERMQDPSAKDEDLSEMFSDEDPNGDGFISQEEWDSTFDRAIGDVANHYVEGKENPNHKHTEEELKMHRNDFDTIDANKDAFIDENEAKVAWTNADGTTDDAWKEQDVDGDGKLSFEEFITLPFSDDDLTELWKELDGYGEGDTVEAEEVVDMENDTVETHDVRDQIDGDLDTILDGVDVDAAAAADAAAQQAAKDSGSASA